MANYKKIKLTKKTSFGLTREVVIECRRYRDSSKRWSAVYVDPCSRLSINLASKAQVKEFVKNNFAY